MGVKKVSQRKKGTYAVYDSKATYNKNRKRDLNKHIKKNPNDECAKKALGNVHYRRKKPNNKGGWIDRKSDAFQGLTKSQAKALAQALKLSKKVANEAMYDKSINKTDKKTNTKKQEGKKGV